jgi:hypothetical protein
VDFARQKLTGLIPTDELGDHEKLAVLSTRIPIGFDVANEAATAKQNILVEKHMRLCLRILPGNFTLETEAPSEPLLAEAAAQLMGHCDPVKTLSEAVSKSGVNLGDRGEQVAALILLQAMDVARHLNSPNGEAREVKLTDFLGELLTSSDSVLKALPFCYHVPDRAQPLANEFADSKIWFNHFVKVDDYQVLNRAFLWGFILRGAGIICASGQAGCDIVLPFVYGDENLSRSNVSTIIIQVKNSTRFSCKLDGLLFDTMNPFKLGIFEKGAAPVPIIRIVMALAAKGSRILPRIPPLRRNKPRSAKAAASKKMNPDCPPANFTSYDLWLAGASHDTFRLITQNETGRYDQILRLSRREPDPSEGMQNPLALRRLRLRAAKGVARAHWTIIKATAHVDTPSARFDLDDETDEEGDIQDSDSEEAGADNAVQ